MDVELHYHFRDRYLSCFLRQIHIISSPSSGGKSINLTLLIKTLSVYLQRSKIRHMFLTEVQVHTGVVLLRGAVVPAIQGTVAGGIGTVRPPVSVEHSVYRYLTYPHTERGRKSRVTSLHERRIHFRLTM